MRKTKKICIYLMGVIAIISTAYSIYKFNFKYITSEGNNEYVVKVIESVKEEDYRLAYLIEYSGNKFLLNIYKSNYGKKINLEDYSNYTYGDILKVKGKLVIPETLGNLYEFNYKRYLNSKNICGVINTYTAVEYIENKSDLKEYMYSFKQYIQDIIDKTQEKNNAVLTKSYIYGDKKELAQNVKENYDALGLSHMLVASGASIGILIIILKKICKILKINNNITYILIIIQIVIYMFLCNFNYSILRAGIVGILSCIMYIQNKKITFFKKLFITIYIIYVLNPMCIFSISFWLSLLAVLSIMLFYSKLEVRLIWLLKSKINSKIFKWLAFPIKICCISLAVKILTFPITINTFNIISFFSIIPNIFIGIIISIIRLFGMFANILVIIPGISEIIYTIIEPFIELTSLLVSMLYKLSINISIQSIPTYIWYIYYALILTIILKDRLVIKDYKKSIIFNKNINKAKQILTYVLVITIIIYKLQNIFSNNYAMFFNVKQGDMAIVKYKDVVILIDAGSENNGLASSILINFCKKENIQKIDAIVISHFHSDHMNGIEEISENIKVNKFIYSLPKEVNDEYFKFKEWINNKRMKTVIVKRGDKLNICKIELCILSPDKDIIYSDDIANSNSLVFTIQIENNKLLFMGDSTIETENVLLQQNILKNDIDLLKVGHHGSKTSTSEKFIQKIRPSVAIISCEKKKYGHPSEETLKLLKKYEIEEYITEKNGAIKIKF